MYNYKSEDHKLSAVEYYLTEDKTQEEGLQKGSSALHSDTHCLFYNIKRDMDMNQPH